MFLKEKGNRSIKARGCADEHSQMEYMTKFDASSPKLSPETIMISRAEEAKKVDMW